MQELARASTAHARIPQRLDQQARATTVDTQRQQALDTLMKRHAAADASIVASLDGARTAADAARQHSENARAQVAAHQQQVDQRAQTLGQAQAQASALEQTLRTAEQDPALLQARAAFQQANLALVQARTAAAQPSRTTRTPGQHWERLQQAEQRLAAASQVLTPLERAVTVAQAAVTAQARVVDEQRQALTTARQQLHEAEQSANAAQRDHAAALARVDTLAHVQSVAAHAVAQQRPALDAHADAAQAAVRAWGGSVEAHRTLATLTSAAAEATAAAHQAAQAVDAQQARVQALAQSLEEGRRAVAPDGALQRQLAQAIRQHAALAALQGGGGQIAPSGGAADAASTGQVSESEKQGEGASAAQPASTASSAAGASKPRVRRLLHRRREPTLAQRVDLASDAVAAARADLQAQEHRNAQTEQTLTQARAALSPLTMALDRSRAAEAAARDARTAQENRTRAADGAAQRAEVVRDAHAAAARGAEAAIGLAVDRLCAAVQSPDGMGAASASASASGLAPTSLSPASTGASLTPSASTQTALPGTIAPEAADRSRLQRVGDTLGRPMHALKNRAAITQLDATIGPLAVAGGAGAPTTFSTSTAPARELTQKLGESQLRGVDKKVSTAAGQMSQLLTGGKGRPGEVDADAAFGSAVALAQEVHRLYASASGATRVGAASLATPAATRVDAASLATPDATRLTDALLRHPNPDPVNRPDGHPLRHEQALLIGSVLRSVTADPAQALQVYEHLRHDPPPELAGVLRRSSIVGGETPATSTASATATTPATSTTSTTPTSPTSTATSTTSAAFPTPSADPAIQRLANNARRALASTAGGMQALLDLQGLSLPPLEHPDRRHAERAVEHYKLGLRAEDALIALGLPVGGLQSTADVQAALNAHPQRDQWLDASRLGTGNARRASGRRDAEHPATLASQAFTYAIANRARAADAPELAPDLKPAYVALRNGFTVSGQGSDFHLMAKRLHKFIKYIDLACQTPVGTLPSAWDRMKHPGRALRRAAGKDKTPLKTLMQAGPMGAQLGTVPGEHRKRLTAALAQSEQLLRADLVAKGPGLSAQDRAQATLRLAALELWAQALPGTADLSGGVKLDRAALLARAQSLAQITALPAGPGASASASSSSASRATGTSDGRGTSGTSGARSALAALGDTAALTQTVDRLVTQPLTPKHLHDWFGDGRLAASRGPRSEDETLKSLNKDIDLLRGKAQFDDDMARLQADFDRADPAGRRDILRQVLISVVAGGDMAGYADGRKNGIGGMFGYGVASVEGLGGLTTGITPVAEFNVDHTRTAVLRAGVASNTGVLFLGNETKVSEMIGGGVRAGAQVGPVGVTGQLMARLGGSHLFSRGLMIRTDKQGTEHQTLPEVTRAGMVSSNWKQMSELVVNTVFDIADQDKAARPAQGGAMWSQVVQRLGDYRDISFGWNEGQAHAVNGGVSLDGIASGGVGSGFRASGVAGVGVKHTFMSRNRARDTAGATQTVQAGSGSRTALTAGASLGVAHPTLKHPDQPDLALFARHKVGVEMEAILQAKNGFVRITTQDGRVNPTISYKHREFAVQDDFIQMLNTQRPLWEARLGTPGPDGVPRGGKEALDAFLKQMMRLPPANNRLFIERKCLTDDAAQGINACLERIAVLQRAAPSGGVPDEGAQRQIEALQRQITQQVEEESSWRPFRLFVNETNQAVLDRSMGVDVRATPASVQDTAAGPTGFAERFLGGGRVTLGGKLSTAAAGRDLITLDAVL